jgi:hypothetical protein
VTPGGRWPATARVMARSIFVRFSFEICEESVSHHPAALVFCALHRNAVDLPKGILPPLMTRSVCAPSHLAVHRQTRRRLSPYASRSLEGKRTRRLQAYVGRPTLPEREELYFLPESDFTPIAARACAPTSLRAGSQTGVLREPANAVLIATCRCIPVASKRWTDGLTFFKRKSHGVHTGAVAG